MLNAYKKSYSKLVKSYEKIEIPNYQRNYVWGEEEWEDFYNDIINIIKLNFKPHFMGTLLFKKNNTSYEIIDGQQRLVTLNIFLMAYRDSYKDRLSFKYIQDFLNNRIVVNDSNNIYDAIYNSTYIKGQRTIDNSESINIEEAYKYFLKKFKVKGLFGKVTTDFNLSRILHKLFFITIEIENDTNPYLIFETLNARGVDLNISDLVKNHLIDRVKGNTALSTFVNVEWEQLTKNLSPEQFEKAFQAYYQSSSNRKKLLKEITINVNEEEEVKEFLKKLGIYIFLYKKLDDITLWEGDNRWINRVRYIKSYANKHLLKIITIAILNNFPKKGRIGAFDFIESLIFRYTIICQKDEEKLLEKLYSVAKQINDKTINTLGKLKESLNEFIIDDEEFKYSFSYRSIEYSRVKPDQIIRYILYKLENYITNSEYIIGISDASIEHIDAHSTSRYNIVYRLANYTLLSKEDNEDAKNDDFITKREKYYKGNSFGLTNNIEGSIVESLANYSLWHIENVKKRQQEMAKIAVKVWNI